MANNNSDDSDRITASEPKQVCLRRRGVDDRYLWACTSFPFRVLTASVQEQTTVENQDHDLAEEGEIVSAPIPDRCVAFSSTVTLARDLQLQPLAMSPPALHSPVDARFVLT
jgi:hypothetical protein